MPRIHLTNNAMRLLSLPTYYLVVLSFLSAIMVLGQSTEPSTAPSTTDLQGRIVYDITRKLEIELPPEMASMRDQIPTEHTLSRETIFTRMHAVSRPTSSESSDQERSTRVASGGAVMEFRMGGGRRSPMIIFTSAADSAQVTQREFLGRDFLISGEAFRQVWRVTSEMSTYQGYMTLKATTTVDSTEVEAWFSPQIPAPFGPDTYGGLPGMILVLTENGGNTTYVAREIALEPIEQEALIAPTRGQAVTQEAYDEIVREKMEEMGMQYSGRPGMGRGMMRIEINN